MVRNVGCGDDVEGGARLNRPALCMTQGLCMRTESKMLHMMHSSRRWR
jgi:hypothetical protein